MDNKAYLLLGLIFTLFIGFMVLLVMYPNPKERQYKYCIDKTNNAHDCALILND